MIYNVYQFYNKLVQAYEFPVFKLEDPNEMVETVGRDYKASPKEAQLKMNEYTLLHLGSYDDVKGTFNLIQPNVLINLVDFYQKKEEVKDD